MIKQNIAITYTATELRTRAAALAHTLCLPLLDYEEAEQSFFSFSAPSITSPQFLLMITPERLELRQTSKRTKPVYVDFLSPAMLYRLQHSGGNKQLLAKAVGVKGGYLPTVLDTTAGFGKDACALAALGCKVHMLERSPIIGTLLQDGLARLQLAESGGSAALAKIVGNLKQLTLTVGVAQEFISANFADDCAAINVPDVIYLDPMYPDEEKRGSKKKSALNKEEMRILRAIVGDDEDVAAVFARALTLARKRVVIKRPKNAPYIIAGYVPQIVYKGSSCRYDVYLTWAS